MNIRFDVAGQMTFSRIAPGAPLVPRSDDIFRPFRVGPGREDSQDGHRDAGDGRSGIAPRNFGSEQQAGSLDWKKWHVDSIIGSNALQSKLTFQSARRPSGETAVQISFRETRQIDALGHQKQKQQQSGYAVESDLREKTDI
jgi:hypothetical protein